MFNPTNDTLSVCKDVYVAWSLLYLSLSPVFVLVLYLGCKQWRKPQPHLDSDTFTFHMAGVELVRIASCCLTVSFYYLPYNLRIESAGAGLESTSTLGQTLFHTLVCTERYLAVVHPIAYVRLKKNGKIIRHVCATTVWLVCFGVLIVDRLVDELFILVLVVTVGVVSVFVVTFFSARVLCVLIRPGPGERGRVDPSKRRAFCTISLITVALFIRFVTLFINYLIYMSGRLDLASFCLLNVSSQWLNIPSVVVLPGLFLHRRKTQP